MSYDRQTAAEWAARYGVVLPPWEDLPTGAVLGTAEVVDCVPAGEAAGPWVEGPWCWVLADPRPFAEPVPFKGFQNLFEVPDAVLFR